MSSLTQSKLKSALLAVVVARHTTVDGLIPQQLLSQYQIGFCPIEYNVVIRPLRVFDSHLDTNMRSTNAVLIRFSAVLLFSVVFVSACSSSGTEPAVVPGVTDGAEGGEVESANGQINADGSNLPTDNGAGDSANQTENNALDQTGSDAGMSDNIDGDLPENSTNVPGENADQSGSDMVVPDPLLQNTTRISFNISVPAYQSNALQVRLEWNDNELNASWVGDELWTVSDDFPISTDISLTVTFYDNNGAITLGSIDRAIRTGTNSSQLIEIQAEDFFTGFDDDGDGISNLSELLAGTYGIDTSRILLFSETRDFRHDSTETAVAALEELANADGMLTDTAGDSAGVFTDTNLSKYDAVVWVMTSGDVLNADEQAAFERYIQSGGGYAGIHAASFTEYEWPWYGELVGAYFDAHPEVQLATQDVEDGAHPSTAHLGLRWTRTDEWYDYRTNPRARVNVLLTLDEESYSGGGMGADHPSAWYHEYDGGRSWYTGGGHTEASYSEPAFRTHLLGGMRYVAGHTTQ